jgi:acyl-coenzyme A thioesterase PaaI-like protein
MRETDPVDYEALRAGLAQAIPLNQHLGLEVVEIGDGRGVVLLPDDERLRNHVGSQHAGGLFSAGEAASGAAFLGSFAEHLAGLTPLARSAQIEYLKLAKGPITATGTLDGGAAPLLEQLEVDGRVQFPVAVSLEDQQGVEVARMTVDWHVRKNP